VVRPLEDEPVAEAPPAKPAREPKIKPELPEGAPRPRVDKALPRFTLDERAPVERAPSIGPKTAKRIFAELDLKTVDDVREAANAGRIRALSGLGEKTEAIILAGLADGGDGTAPVPRRSIARARTLGEKVLEDLRACDGVIRCELAGSVRRYKETSKDVDVVAAVSDRFAAADAFTVGEWVAEVVSRGDSRVTASAHDGTVVELRMVPGGCYGNLF